MIARRLSPTLLSRLDQFPAVALLGPRQVGKTTLARAIGEARSSIYLDLERLSDRRRLSDPALYLSAHEDRLVIFDEIQFMPELFRELRGLIDDGRRRGRPQGRFLLLGSASGELLRQSSESLAGRIAYMDLDPLDVSEVPPEHRDRLWTRGGFPDSYLADSGSASAVWRENFLRTYLERYIPQVGPRIPAETLRRFWTMLAHAQGQLLNAAQLARNLAVDGKTVARYLDLMVDLLVIRKLPPHRGNAGKRLVKSSRTYIRDSGLVHTLLGIDDREALLGHPVVGASWEGFVIENLLRAAPERTSGSFYRSASGAEIDLLLELPGRGLWAIEIKQGLAPKLERSFFAAREDLHPEHCFVICSGNERYPKTEGVDVIGLEDLCRELRSLHEPVPSGDVPAGPDRLHGRRC